MITGQEFEKAEDETPTPLEGVASMATGQELGEVEDESSTSPLEDVAPATTGQELGEAEDETPTTPLEGVTPMTTGQGPGEAEDEIPTCPLEDMAPATTCQELGEVEDEPSSSPLEDVLPVSPGRELGEVEDEPSSSPPEDVTPTTTSRQLEDSYEGFSSPFLENVPPAAPGSIQKTVSPINRISSQSPKRRLHYIEASQSGEAGPSTPARRLRENIQIAPDSVSRKRYGRRASSDLFNMANEPLMETLKALARGYLVRKRIGPFESEDPSNSNDGQRKEEEIKQFGILDTFIRKHEEKAKSAPPSRIPTPVRNVCFSFPSFTHVYFADNFA